MNPASTGAGEDAVFVHGPGAGGRPRRGPAGQRGADLIAGHRDAPAGCLPHHGHRVNGLAGRVQISHHAGVTAASCSTIS